MKILLSKNKTKTILIRWTGLRQAKKHMKKTPLPEINFQGRERNASCYHLNLSAPHGSGPLQVRKKEI